MIDHILHVEVNHADDPEADEEFRAQASEVTKRWPGMESIITAQEFQRLEFVVGLRQVTISFDQHWEVSVVSEDQVGDAVLTPFQEGALEWWKQRTEPNRHYQIEQVFPGETVVDRRRREGITALAKMGAVYIDERGWVRGGCPLTPAGQGAVERYEQAA